MKQLLTSLLALSLLASACKKEQDIISPDQTGPTNGPSTGTPSGTTNQPGSPTEVGKPVGAMASKTIGPAGGTLMASDGKLTLTIPAGALAKETMISVEPVENTSGLSVGTGYHFMPEGTQFAKPATFIYRYTDEEMTGADPSHLGLAVQQPDRSWLLTRRAIIDKTQRTITSQIRHFSWWSVVTQYKLTAKKTELVPGEQTELTLLYSNISFREAQTLDEELVSPIVPVSNMNALREWTVNGQLFPNTAVDGSLAIYPDQSPFKIVYMAPDKLPAKNKRVAAVSFQVEVNGAAKLLLVANIRIVPPGELTVDGTTYDDVVVSVVASKDASDLLGYYLTMEAITTTGKKIRFTATARNFTGVGVYTLEGHKNTYVTDYAYLKTDGGKAYENQYWGTCHCEIPPLIDVPVSLKVTQYDGEGKTTQGTFSGTLYQDMKSDKSVSVSARFRAIVHE